MPRALRSRLDRPAPSPRPCEPWGNAYHRRTKGKETGRECVVCGKQTGDAPACYAVASPATGGFVAAALADTPEGAAIETSAYPVGPECAKRVRAVAAGSIVPAATA